MHSRISRLKQHANLVPRDSTPLATTVPRVNLATPVRLDKVVKSAPVVGFEWPKTKTASDANNATWEKPQRTKPGQLPAQIVIWVDLAVPKVPVPIALRTNTKTKENN